VCSSDLGDDRLRVYLYHFPRMSMTPITVSLAQRLKNDFGPVIAGLKDSTGEFESALGFMNVGDDFDVFPANEAIMLDAIGAGCAGIISATTNASAALARLTLSSSGQVAKDHQKTLTAVRAVISKYPLSAALKQIEAWRSGDDTWLSVLPPQIGLSIEQANELHADLEALEPSAGILGKKLNAA